MTWMQAGRTAFDLLSPQPEDVHLAEMARSLAHINRFTGHAGPWSVAAHSLLVTYLLSGSTNPFRRLAALLHDAHEAYTGDISTPMARAIEYVAECRCGQRLDVIAYIKANVQRAIDRAADLPTQMHPSAHEAIRAADLRALNIERGRFLPPEPEEWGTGDVEPWPAGFVRDWTPGQAERVWIAAVRAAICEAGLQPMPGFLDGTAVGMSA